MELYKRITAEQIGPSGTSFLAAWLFFQIAANHVFLPILVITFVFSKRAAKHPAVINICLTWIVTGVISSILFYLNKETGDEPSTSACIAQASLMSGVAPMTTTAVLILFAYLSMSLTPHRYDSTVRRVGILFNPALLALPYLVFGLFASIGVGLAMQHPDRVSREHRFFYCSLDWPALTDAVTIISTLVCLTTVVLGARIWRLLSWNWQSVRESDGVIDLDLIVRSSIFAFYLFASTLISLAANWSMRLQQSVAPDMISASIGMALFLILASNRAVLNTWAFWKRHPGTSAPPSSPLPFKSVPTDRTSSFLQMPTLEDGALPETSSSETYLGRAESVIKIKQYYEGKLGPQTQSREGTPVASGGGVTIIRKPEEAFGSRFREREDSVVSEEQGYRPPTMYVPRSPPSARAQERLVTALEYDQDRERESSIRESWV